MPQSDALLPWRRVLDNATLGLEVRGMRAARGARARAAAARRRSGSTASRARIPFQLSGGMRQRAALLRTVVQECEVLLLDEPFGALDALTRAEMQRWLESVWARFRWTVLLITHDVREAVYLADRIYVLSPRPGTVVAELAVPLPRPRTLATLTDPRLAQLETELLAHAAQLTVREELQHRRVEGVGVLPQAARGRPAPRPTSSCGSSSCSRRESLG